MAGTGQTQAGEVIFGEAESWKTGSAAKQDRQAQYISWLCTPASERDPSTKTELAKQLGVSIQTLGNYTREPLFQKRLVREQARLRRVEKADIVMQRLYERATDEQGGAPANTAAKIWLDYTLSAELVDEDESVNFEEMDDADIENLVIRFLQTKAKG